MRTNDNSGLWLVLVLGGCLCAGVAQATNVLWDAGGGVDRDWSTALNWSADVEPAATDHVFIGNSYTGVVTTAGRVAANTYIGYVAATGTLLQTGGSLSVSNFVVGSATNTEGLYILNDGSLTVGVRMVVGASGAATAVVDGVNASININENLYVGISNANNRAVFLQHAGLVTASNVLIGGITSATDGRYVIMGGTLTAVGQIYMGNGNANSTGRLEMAGGSLNSSFINIGRNGHGLMTVGGTATVNVNVAGADILIGDISTVSNTLEVSGDAVVNIADDLLLGNSGTGVNGILRIKDNGLVSLGNEVVIGRVATSTGRVEMTGGRLVTTSGPLTVGNGSLGLLYVSGTATVDLNGAVGDLIVGSSSTASNTLDISGYGTVEVQDELLACSSADGARGYIRISENGRLIVGRNLLLGQRPSTVAEILMEGGELMVTSVFFVGNASNAMGQVTINDGIVTAITHMALGKVANATGMVTMAGGILYAGGNLEVGNVGSGFVSISGGALNTGGPLIVPVSGPGGVFEVIGSAPSITIGDSTTEDMLINSNGHLKAVFSGGAIAPILVQDDIVISTNATLTLDAVGTVADGSYVIATSLNSSVVSGGFGVTNWLGGLSGTISYTNRSILVTLTGGVASPYDTWATGYGLAGDDASPTNDPDHDTWHNQLEYGFGGNPTNAGDAGIFPAWARKTSGELEVVYRRRLDAALRGLTYQVQAETNLSAATWSTNDTTEIGAAPIDADFESVTNRIAPGVIRFGRVEVGLEQ